MITQTTKPPTLENEILNRYLIDGSHDIKSIFGLIASAIVSTIGVYNFLDSVTTTERALYIAIGFFITLLAVVDTIKRGALTKYFNGLLKKLIRGLNIAIFYLFIAIFGAIFAFTLDIVGSHSTAQFLIKKYQEHKSTSSKEFEILEANAKSGKDSTMLYIQMVNDWRADEQKAKQDCDSKWRVPKYRTKNSQCMENWRNSNPKPTKEILNTQSTISLSDYKAIQTQNEDFITRYGFYIAFALFVALTALFQYLTIAKLYDQYREILESLTTERIEFINDTIKEHESILAEHEQQVAEMMADSEREKKAQDRKFQEVGEAIAITHKKKLVNTRAKTVKRIANNDYVPQEQSKTAHIYTGKEPFNKEEIIYKLFLNGEAKKGDKLTAKGELINIKNRAENEKMVALYSELERLGLINNKTGRGYYALVDYTSLTNE